MRTALHLFVSLTSVPADGRWEACTGARRWKLGWVPHTAIERYEQTPRCTAAAGADTGVATASYLLLIFEGAWLAAQQHNEATTCVINILTATVYETLPCLLSPSCGVLCLAIEDLCTDEDGLSRQLLSRMCLPLPGTPAGQGWNGNLIPHRKD